MSKPNLGEQRPGPLSGIVVADLSRIMAGPYCTMLLADMGATVIKIEGPLGDDTRHFAPPVRESVATYYQSANRNKRSIVLDFSLPNDLATTREIIRGADVVIENFKAGGLAQFGLDYPSLSRDRTDLIYASITGFGAGKGAKYAGYDLMVQALSGFMDTTGDPEGDPYRAGFAVFDVLTGLHTAVGILAALHHRDLTGDGQLIETNLLSVALSSMVNQTQAYLGAGVVPRRMGNEHPSLYPYEPFPTADRPIVIAVGNDSQFGRLCSVLGMPKVADSPLFASTPLRNQHRAQLRPLLAASLANRTAGEWFDVLSDAGVPCAPIQTVEEGVRFAQRIGLDPVVESGGIPLVRNPLSFSLTPVDYPLPPPRLGEQAAFIQSLLDNSHLTEEPS